MLQNNALRQSKNFDVPKDVPETGCNALNTDDILRTYSGASNTNLKTKSFLSGSSKGTTGLIFSSA